MTPIFDTSNRLSPFFILKKRYVRDSKRFFEARARRALSAIWITAKPQILPLPLPLPPRTLIRASILASWILGWKGWKGKKRSFIPACGDVVHFRPHPSSRGIRGRSRGIKRKESFCSPSHGGAERLTRVGAIFSRRINLSAILMTTVLRIIRRGYPLYSSLLGWSQLSWKIDCASTNLSLSRSLSLCLPLRPFRSAGKRKTRVGKKRNDDVVVVDKREFLSSAAIEANYFRRDEYL